MRGRRPRAPSSAWPVAGAVLALAAAAVAATPDAAATPDTDLGPAAVDPAELDALLAELEARGGLLTAAERAELAAGLDAEAPGGSPGSADRRARRGRWDLALVRRPDRPLRWRVTAAARGAGWSLRLRADGRGESRRIAAWARGGGPGWQAALGDGWAVCGGGLLLAGPGRGRLGADEPLRLLRPRWRPTAALTAARPPAAGAVRLQRAGWSLAAGGGRLADAGEAGHLQLAWRGDRQQVAVTGVRRPDGRGRAVDLALDQGPWRLQAAAARWRLRSGARGQAWAAHGAVHGASWRLGAQVAAAGGAEGLEGSRRPAALAGWHGRGWALRGRLDPTPDLRVAAVAGISRDREPRTARGRRRRRTTVEVRVDGRGAGGVAWELRLRRVTDRWRAWATAAPWRPAAADGHRTRQWLAAAVSRPLAVGEGRLAWRRLEEAGAARDLVALRWQRQRRGVRLRLALRVAWGDPVDLVAVSAPVAGLVRLRHWGAWRQGLSLGLRGGERWRWRLGVEWRQRAGDGGGGPPVEALAAWGRRF